MIFGFIVICFFLGVLFSLLSHVHDHIRWIEDKLLESKVIKEDESDGFFRDRPS